jgi:hypothetical protein
MPKFKIASRLAALASVILLSLSACGGGGGDKPQPPDEHISGAIRGQVADAQTGEPIAGVEIKLGTLITTTDSNGNYLLGGVPLGTDRVAQFSKPQYASSFATVDVADVRATVVDRRLAKVGVSKDVSGTAGGVVVLAGSAAQVDLPAGGFVNAASGTPYTGTVSVSMTSIDPRASPQAMPGNYRAQGETAPIESMGALQVEMRDSGGALLNLAPGKTATIRIPVPAGVLSPPLAIPLYFFKEATGLWVREGMATLRGTLPAQYYEGTVSHFTWWNADQPLETIYINGCVTNATGQPLDATVTARGIDYSGTSTVNTLPGGLFKIPARRNSEVQLMAQNGDDVATIVVKTGNTDMTVSPCLVLSQTPPVIVTQPASQTVAPNNFISLNVVANNASQYRWYRDGVLIASGSPNLWLVGVAGNYTVVVSNAHGSVTSEIAIVKVAEPVAVPVIAAQPDETSVVVGSTATFAVTAQGESLRYQWLRNGVVVPSANGPRLTLPSMALSDDGSNYSCVVSNNAGSVTSAAATLHVTGAAVAVTVTQQPSSVAVLAGQRAMFAVRATGTGPISYQWNLNGNPIAGANAASYQTAQTVSADSGGVYTVSISNIKGTVLSNAATLTVMLDGGVPGLHLSFLSGNRINGEFAYGAIPEAGGNAVSFVAAGESSVTGMLVQGQVSNNMVSGMHIHGMLYWKNNQLFRRDLAGGANGLPGEMQVSSLSGAGVCNKEVGGSSGVADTGGDLADASRSWRVFQKPGNDNLCNTDDDRFFAVRVNMAASDAALEVPRPVATIHSATGALSGWLVRNGQLMQRVNADFSSPVTLFTLPAGELSFEMDAGLDNTWVFTVGDKVYAVDLASAAPAALTPIATLAAGETMFSSTQVVDKSLFIAIGSISSTRVVRYVLTTKAVNAVGSVPGISSILTVTPTRVMMHGALGTLVALPVGGGAAQTVYTPPTPRLSFTVQRGGERVWQDMQDSVVSVNSDGSGVLVLPGAKLAGCLYRAQASIDGDPLMCDAVIIVDGNVARSYDATTGALRLIYGTVSLPPAPSYSMFMVSFLATWGKPFVLSQYVINPNDANQMSVANYYIKSGVPGITPIAF